MKRLLIAIFPFLLLLACGTVDKAKDQWSELSALDKAKKVEESYDNMLSSQKDSIQKQYEMYQTAGDKEGIGFILEEVDPIITKAEKASEAFHNAVYLWEVGSKPDNYKQRKEAFKSVLDELAKLILEEMP